MITVQPPEHGRSGGGLFLEEGTLVGVCTGRAEMVKGLNAGVFSSAASVRRLLLEHGLDEALERSEARRAALKPGTVLTPTRARRKTRRADPVGSDPSASRTSRVTVGFVGWVATRPVRNAGSRPSLRLCRGRDPRCKMRSGS